MFGCLKDFNSSPISYSCPNSKHSIWKLIFVIKFWTLFVISEKSWKWCHRCWSGPASAPSDSKKWPGSFAPYEHQFFWYFFSSSLNLQYTAVFFWGVAVFLGENGRFYRILGGSFFTLAFIIWPTTCTQLFGILIIFLNWNFVYCVHSYLLKWVPFTFCRLI